MVHYLLGWLGVFMSHSGLGRMTAVYRDRVVMMQCKMQSQIALYYAPKLGDRFRHLGSTSYGAQIDVG